MRVRLPQLLPRRPATWVGGSPSPASTRPVRLLANGALVIFDEVLTGFRVFGGLLGLPRLPRMAWAGFPIFSRSVLAIGGGMPIAALEPVSVRAHGYLAPVGPVYQVGTLSRNPLSVAAVLRP